MNWRLTLMLAGTAAVVSACDGPGTGQLQNQIVSTQIDASANDGDSATPPVTINAAGEAKDGDTRAVSDAPQFDRVSGLVDAQPTNVAAPTLTEDFAVARSFNKVISTLVVTKKGTFTFDVEVKVEGVELVHEATLKVDVRAAILDANGVSVPNGGITSQDAEITPNPQGGAPQVTTGIAPNTTTNPLNANGVYNPTLSGPTNGIELDVGTYQVELDLRLTARARIVAGPDGRKPRAKVDKATAIVKLR